MLLALFVAAALQAQDPPGFWDRDTLLGDPGGVRADLADGGLSWTLSYTGEVISNVSGGLQKDTGVDHLLDWVIDADFQKMLGWTGGAARINPMFLAGDGLATEVGDLTKVSNITGRGGPRIFEFWLQQSLFEGALSLRAGILAADQEFAISTAGLLYYNSVFGGPVFLTPNLTWPIYPVGSPGIRLRTDPAPGIYVQGAVYDGDPQTEEFNRYGVRVRWNHDQGVFSILEGGWTFGEQLPATLKAGVFYHSADFNRYDTGTPGHGLIGGYVVFEKRVWREGPLPGSLDASLRCGTSEEDRSFVALGIDAALNFTGLLSSRPRDVLGLGWIYARLGQDFVDAQANPGPWGYESVIEVTYKAVLTPAWSLQPDVQVIFHPGGSSLTPRATVVGLRIDLVF